MKAEDLEPKDRTGVGPRIVILAFGLFAVIATLSGVDSAADYRIGTETHHLLTEAIVMGLALVGVVVLWQQFRSVQQRAEQLSVDLAVAQQEAQRFRKEAHEALRGLGEAIDRQFT